MRVVANNKKARHDYFIEDTYEAGISLAGTEVKSLRLGKCSLKESFIKEEKGELFIYGMHISPYEKGNIFNKDPLRPRKLLLHRTEINKLLGKTKEKDFSFGFSHDLYYLCMHEYENERDGTAILFFLGVVGGVPANVCVVVSACTPSSAL